MKFMPPNDQMPAIWDAVFKAGENYGIKAIGLRCPGIHSGSKLVFAFMEMILPIPLLRLKPAWDGSPALIKIFFQKQFFFGTKRKRLFKKHFAVFELIDKGIPRHEFKLYSKNMELIG